MLFDCEDEIDLNEYFKAPFQKHGLFKCRIIYTTQIEKTGFLPYQLPKIRTLKMVVNDKIDYSHKYTDRKAIEKLLEQKGDCDDILIIKNGLITDTSFCNILFFNGKEWLTPVLPLLKGTQRAWLFDAEMIRTADIRVEDLRYFRKARLINAMIRFEDQLDIPVENIKPY